MQVYELLAAYYVQGVETPFVELRKFFSEVEAERYKSDTLTDINNKLKASKMIAMFDTAHTEDVFIHPSHLKYLKIKISYRNDQNN